MDNDSQKVRGVPILALVIEELQRIRQYEKALDHALFINLMFQKYRNILTRGNIDKTTKT